MLTACRLTAKPPTASMSLGSLALLILLGGSGCSTMPDCDESEAGPVSGLFAPLDNAVGKVNQDLNDQEGDEGCGMMKSSEANKIE